MKTSIKGFSFIELITAISIIILLSVIWTTAYSSMQQKSDNSKVISDLRTIANSLSNYKEAEKSLPMPSWNLSFYKDDTSYAHSYDEAFWVSWFIKENTIDKKYMNFLPIDPKTLQFYWYAKTKKYLSYEVSWVIYENDNPTSLVVWNWWGEEWPYNLVREYAWPNFVFDKSTNYFPYNPYEKKLIAKINSFSWDLKVNDKPILDSDLKDLSLVAWDKIFVWTSWSVNIYYSDWSNSVLWNKNTASEVVLANLSFKDNSNLFSSIKLALNMWSIWTKAAKLDTNSEFEVYTADEVAAVRWTVFWLTKGTNYSNITVLEWKVEVAKIRNNDDLINNIKNNSIDTENIYLTWTTTTSSGKTYIEVQNNSPAKWINIYSSYSQQANVLSSTWNILEIPDEVKSQVIDWDWIINENLQIKLESFNSTTKTLKLSINNTLKTALKMLINKEEEEEEETNWKESYLTWNYLIFTWGIIEKNPILKIKLCDNLNNCSKEFSFNTTWWVSIENANVSITNQECWEWFKYFEKWWCVENLLYSSWYKIIAYASLKDRNSLFLDIDWDKINNSWSWNIFSSWENYFTTWANIKYNLNKLISNYNLKTWGTWSSIWYEFEILWQKLLESPINNKYILSYGSCGLTTKSGSLAFNNNINAPLTNKWINPNSYYKVYTILDWNYLEVWINWITKIFNQNFTGLHIQQIISLWNKINLKNPFNWEIKNFKIYYKP